MVSNCRLWIFALGLLVDGYIDDDNNRYLVYYPHGGVALMPLECSVEAIIYPG